MICDGEMALKDQQLCTFPVLGVQITACDYASIVAEVISAAREPRALTVAPTAVHGLVTGVLDPAFRACLNEIDHVLPDGQPVRWALNGLHQAGLAERVYGPTLMLHILEAAAEQGLPVYFFGSRVETLSLLKERLSERFPQLTFAGLRAAEYREGSEAEVAVLAEAIVESGARICFVGLGCPRQEIFAWEMRKRLGLPLICVGAAFDFHAGIIPQAPWWMQDGGLEWLFRLSREPRRLWRRYILYNPLYVLLILLQRLGWKPREKSSLPQRRRNYV